MAGLASILESTPHLAAFKTMAEQRFAAFDRTVLLMYLIDTAPSQALENLARQFDVLGWKGWLFAETEQEKRDLLKKAIELQRKKGTPFAIREALRAVNDQYGQIDIIKVEGELFDGTHDFDGDIDYAGGFWANFLVRIFVPDAYPFSAEDNILARRIINEYKNERSQLLFVDWRNALTGGPITIFTPPDIIAPGP